MADTLFTFDDEQVVNDGPVTCLGIQFENDAKRREFFREELRKKLPELRLMEGFPIGEDDDIIALSDPPYYTACPNPWINDFIKEWEAEKAVLFNEGKRKASFDVKEPYAADVNSIKNDSVYRSIVYHTKVPQEIVKKFLMHYTQPGDIVLDGFAGTGMTGLACQTCNTDSGKKNGGKRHCICGDLSPYAETVAYGINTPSLINKTKPEISRIEQEIISEYGWMFTTKHQNQKDATINCVIWSDSVICPNCGKQIVLWNNVVHKESKTLSDIVTCEGCGSTFKSDGAERVFETIYDENNETTRSIIKSTPVRIIYTYNGNRYEKIPDDYDWAVLKRIEEFKISTRFPKDKLPDGFNTQQPIKTQGYQYVYDFYTKRNLIILSAFYDKIMKSPLSQKLLYVFDSMIIRSTKLNRVHFTKYLNGKTDWDAGNLKGTLYVPSFPVESSVIAQIKNKLNRFEKASEFLPTEYDSLISVSSASAIPLCDNSIDYIFVDPPFGANIMYSELNFISESWLRVKTNNQTEAIENPGQGKDSAFYFNMMSRCFKEFYRVLKPGRWMTVEFSNTKASVWNLIQESINKAGFIIANVSTLDKGQGGLRSISSSIAVKQDLAISCFKTTDNLTNKFYSSVDTSNNVWDFIEELLEHLPSHLIKDSKLTTVVERTPKVLYDRLVAYYVQHSYQVPLDAIDFQKGLKEHFVERDGMFFTAEQAIEYDEVKKETAAFVSLALMVGSEEDGIEWLKRELEDSPKKYSEILPEWMQGLVAPKKGDKLPELLQILDENFLKDEEGYWHVPDLNDQSQLEAVRNKRLLKEFEVYVEAKKVKNARLEALRAGFKECYKNKDFATIVAVGDKIDEELLTTDEVLLRFYDIASTRI